MKQRYIDIFDLYWFDLLAYFHILYIKTIVIRLQIL